MPQISPVAEYLRINKAIPKHDKYGCNFFSPEGLYLGRLTKTNVGNYKVISLNVMGDNLKPMYSKSVAYGQQYAYIKNSTVPLGISIAAVKTYMRKVFADFIEGKTKMEDYEKTLANKLNLIAVDESTGTCLYDINKPFMYNNKITNTECKKIKFSHFLHTIH